MHMTGSTPVNLVFMPGPAAFVKDACRSVHRLVTRLIRAGSWLVSAKRSSEGGTAPEWKCLPGAAKSGPVSAKSAPQTA